MPSLARSDRRNPLIWVAVATAAIAFAVWELTVGAHASLRVQSCANCTTIAIPAIACLATAYRTRADRRTASAWLGIGVGLSLTTSGYVVEIVYLFSRGWVPYPSAADLLFLGCYPIFLVGLLRFPTRPQTRAERLRLGLDVATLTVCAASVIWRVVLAPTISSGDSHSLAVLVSDAYPTADFLMVFGVVRLLLRGVSPGVRRAAQFLGLGMFATIVGDVFYAYAALHSNTINGSYSSIAYVAADAFFLCAAISQRRPGPAVEPAARVDDSAAARNRTIDRLPYLAPVIIIALLIETQFTHSELSRVVITIAAGVVLLLVSARQVTVQQELTATVEIVTDQKEQLRHQALHDALTGLPNRALILDRVEGALSRARRQTTAVGVMFIDLDGFKRINDTYGHATGDRLLCEVSLRLAATLRESDTIGRLGGDEFVILVESDTFDLGAERIADRIRDALSAPFFLGTNQEVAVIARASIGIAVGLRSSADELLRDADVALYAAKDAGKDRYVLFAHEMQTAVQERLQLEMDLRDAQGTDQFFLLYQPTVDLRTGAVTGTEALVRWRHPTRGLVMPDDFISVSEETGLIVSLGRWVLNEACRQTAEWQRAGHQLAVSVNVSSRQLDDDIDLVADVADALSASGLDPASLTLEITENVLVRDTEASAHRLRMLKRLGVRISIDDFGTGYSSIAYLQRFTVDALKIDRAFVSAIGTSAEADALVHTLVQLGTALGLETCAEGIEDDVQLQSLRREGCDSVQGYLFARPLSPADLAAYVEARSTLDIHWDEPVSQIRH